MANAGGRWDGGQSEEDVFMAVSVSLGLKRVNPPTSAATD
jgi:hypothetical protein